MAKTIEQLQIFVDRKPDIREVINEVVDFLQANPAGESSVPLFPAGTKVYCALASQAGSSNPTVIVPVNTLGGTVVWTRGSAGSYNGTLAGAFPSGKTLPFISVGGGGGATNFYRVDDNSVQIVTDGDEILSAAPILILVFP